MKNLFSFRSEWRDYCVDCWANGEIPWSFKHWFETSYYYDMVDDMPTGSQFDGTFSHYASVCLN